MFFEKTILRKGILQKIICNFTGLKKHRYKMPVFNSGTD